MMCRATALTDRDMIKLFGLVTRRDDLTLEQFSRHWRTVHRQLALRLVAPGIMRGYVQNHRRPGIVVPGVRAPCDGSPEVWLDSPDMLVRLASSPEYLEGAGPDEPNFMQGGAANCLAETVVFAGEARASVASRVKALVFFRRGSQLPGNGAAEWGATQSWLMPRAAPLRLERERCLTGFDNVATAPYAAIEATWWPDYPSFEAAWAGRVTTAPAFDCEAMVVEDLQVLLPTSGV
jgi:hypothetical protein